MNHSSVEAICLAMQRIWINKAQYADAERQFQIAVQKEGEDQMTLKSKNKSRKTANKAKTSKPRDSEAPLFKIDKSKKQIKDGLTPYQGGKRCFVQFKCKPCNRKWVSAYSWANMGQQCKRCNRNAYPYKQHEIKAVKRDERELAMVKEHDTTKCEKCQQIRGDCRSLVFRF